MVSGSLVVSTCCPTKGHTEVAGMHIKFIFRCGWMPTLVLRSILTSSHRLSISIYGTRRGRSHMEYDSLCLCMLLMALHSELDALA